MQNKEDLETSRIIVEISAPLKEVYRRICRLNNRDISKDIREHIATTIKLYRKQLREEKRGA